MNLRLTGILALIAAVLALLIAFWDRDDDTERMRLEQARRAFRFDAARVDRLILESGDVSIHCRMRANRWYLERPIAARADPVAIERLLGALQELPRGDIILPPRRSPNPYGPYGLDEPRARIAIIEGSVTNKILNGRRTPLGDGVYVRQSDHAGLARIQTTLLDLLPASAEALRDRSLLSGTPASIDRLDIRGPAGYIQLARDAGGTWRLFQPFTARADSATVVALIEQLLAGTVVQFVQDAVSDLAPYGLDSQGAVTALLNTDTGEGSQMLALGDPLPNAQHLVYARLQAEHSVYAVPQSVRQALLVRPDDLRDRRVPGLLPEAIRHIRVEEGEIALELEHDGSQWQMTVPVQSPANALAVESLLRSWADIRLVEFESRPPSNAAPLARSLRIQLRDPKLAPVLLRLGPHPTQTGHARIDIDGDSSIAVAAPATLLDFPLDPLHYRSREIASFPVEDIAVIQIANGSQTIRIVRDPATGRWTPDAPWLEQFLPAIAPLRAESLLYSQTDAVESFEPPHLTVSLQLLGQTGLAATLLVGNELTPGGPRRATLRGRDLVFSLSPTVVDALRPPPLKDAE